VASGSSGTGQRAPDATTPGGRGGEGVLSQLDSMAGDGGILAVAAGLFRRWAAALWLPRLLGFQTVVRVAAVGGAVG